MTIIEHIRQHAVSTPDKTAVEDGDRKTSYKALVQIADNLSCNLQHYGIKKGDVVAFQLKNCPEQCALMLAIGICGGVMLPIRHYARAAEVYQAMAELDIRTFVGKKGNALPPGATRLSLESLMENRDDGTRDFQKVAISADDPYLIIQSSGTTGSPKYFVSSHELALDNAQKFCTRRWWHRRIRYYMNMDMPMGDVWGCHDCLALMYFGATIVLPQEKNLTAIAAEINEKNISTVALPPWQLRLYLKKARPGEMLLPGVSFLESGGSTLTLSEKEQVMAKITPHLYDFYGATEFWYVSMAGPSDHSKKPGTVGSVMEGVEVQVVDDDHHPLDPGCTGLLRFRTAPMIREYLNNPDATARNFRDGWFYPMDVGYLDEDGYLFLTGRFDDRIDCMGENFYPMEAERILLTYPGIEEAIVFGWPHTIKGEVAAAAYVSTEPLDARDIIAFCKSSLENYKVPRYCIGLEFIPRNQNGKVEVRAIKAMLKRSIRDGKSLVQH